MKQIKNLAFIALSAILLWSVVYGGYRVISTDDETSDLLMANVEALTDGECTTTWGCAPGPGKCNAMCGKCGIFVSGEGILIGTHCCGD